VDSGGSLAFVVAGSVRVRLPGAPGCTTTGFGGAGCCAAARKGDKPEKEFATASTPEHAATLTTTRIAQVKQRGLTSRKYLFIVGLAFSNLCSNFQHFAIGKKSWQKKEGRKTAGAQEARGREPMVAVAHALQNSQRFPAPFFLSVFWLLHFVLRIQRCLKYYQSWRSFKMDLPRASEKPR